ncbi:non-specific serine/threonine protein kinase [Entamoeba marina]
MTSASKPTYRIHRKLGQGGFGQILLDRASKQAASNEVRIMKKVSHPNVITFFDSFINTNSLVIIMEFGNGGDLGQFIKRRLGDPIPEELVWNIFLQITFGLKYLHSIHVLHRDVKTQNIFMMEDGTAKIGDFGIGRIFKTDDQRAKTMIGTPHYLSPEICIGKAYGYKSDMWSLGCVLYELCALQRAFPGSNVCEVVRKITSTIQPPIPHRYAPILLKFVDALLSKAPEERPSTFDICDTEEVKVIVEKLIKRYVHSKNASEGSSLKLQTNEDELMKGSPEQSPTTSPSKNQTTMSENKQHSWILEAIKQTKAALEAPMNELNKKELEKQIEDLEYELSRCIGEDLSSIYGMVADSFDNIPEVEKKFPNSVDYLGKIIEYHAKMVLKERIVLLN